MPLIELLNTTKLRSLGFGHDQPHGGSSPQPYVQTQISTKKELDRPSPDFLLRGATNADPFLSTGKDLERIGKWFFQEPAKGTLFIAKQNLLSRTAAATDVSSAKLSGFLNGGLYLPTSTLAQVGVSAFGLHLNKQGLNPIPSDPGAGFLQSLLSIGSQPLYGITAWQLENTLNSEQIIYLDEKNLSSINQIANRLGLSIGKKLDIPLFSNKKGILVSFDKVNNFLLKLFSGRILDTSYISDVYSYSGGPGSILGLGNTNIRFSTNAGGIPIRTNLNNNDGSSDVNLDGFQKGGAITYTQREIQVNGVPYFITNGGKIVGSENYSDFRTQLRTRMAKANSNSNAFWWLMDGGDYTSENIIENRTLIGDPGKLNIIDNNEQWKLNQKTKGDELNRSSPIVPNFTNIFNKSGEDEEVRTLKEVTDLYDKDLVTFRIQIINSDAPSDENSDLILYFRAFLDTITDTYSAEWDSVQYIGRGDKLYHYKGFDRQISLGWTVAAQSKEELKPMYTRLNKLAEVICPDYSSLGFMRGQLVKLTIGGYIHEQIGIIKGFSYEIREEYPWEIAINDNSKLPQLPHVIKVNGFQFIPFVNDLSSTTFIDRFIKTIPTKEGNEYEPSVTNKESASPPQEELNSEETNQTTDPPPDEPVIMKKEAYENVEGDSSQEVKLGSDGSSVTNNPSYTTEQKVEEIWKRMVPFINRGNKY